MLRLCRPERIVGKSAVKAATQLALIMLLFGMAECAAGSCLSYGHSCWGAHGKRSGGAGVGVGGVELGVEASGAVAAALQQASPEDTRWFLSKLLANRPSGPPGQSGPQGQQGQQGSLGQPPKTRANYKMWQRFDTSIKDSGDSAEIRDSPISRSDALRLEAEDGDFRVAGEDSQDSGPEGEELLVMASPADEAEINRGTQKLRLYKIMNRASSKNMK